MTNNELTLQTTSLSLTTATALLSLYSYLAPI